MKGEREPIDPNEEAFSDLLASGIQELRRDRGPCPSSETLVAFYEKHLPEEKAAQVRKHVEACGLCDVQLGRLEAADKRRRRSVGAALWTVLRHPAFAYGLVALLLWPAYRGIVPRGASPQLGIMTVPIFSLDLVRSDSQNQKSAGVQLTPSDKFFVLSFFVPLQTSPPEQYEVVIVRDEKAAVAPAQALRNCDRIGNCRMVCNAALFELGHYELRVRQTTSQGKEVVDRFPFEVTR